MNIAFIGLGKLGLPVSLAINQKGHNVYGYDAKPEVRESLRKGETSLYEPGIIKDLKEALESGTFTITDSLMDAVNPLKVRHAPSQIDIIFFAVQTPSYQDNSFDVSFLKDAVKEANKFVHPETLFVIISTVLPGTIRKEIWPIVGKDKRRLCYNASFIAMGTTKADFLDPEFILIGESDKEAGKILEQFYDTIIPKAIPRLHMTWEEAETVKMGYNTIIGFKIVFANTLMELCHKIGNANVDTVTDALAKGYRRVTGPRYLRGGMGDGGACHPRDNLALSHLAAKLDLSADPFRLVMDSRKKQAKWLAEQMVGYGPPYFILGKRYKKGTNLTDYSASDLVKSELQQITGKNVQFYDPVLELTPELKRGTYLVGIDDDFIHQIEFPEKSTILDPWRCLNPSPKNCYYVPVGIS